ncbi:MAG TPA: hypothetical protein VH518_24320 [Tepidisphaeraceae bacterium]
MEMIQMPGHWPVQADLLQWAQNMSPGTATILVIGGMVYLLFGYIIFKWLVMLNAGLVGAFIGGKIGEKGGSMPAGACVGAFVCAAITWPMMKYAVAFMGGIFGVLLGTSVWRALGLESNFAWAGSLIGLVLFGLLSFILFKGSVMMYTSLQGSVMLIFGILGLIYKYQSIAPQVTENMTLKPFILPLSIFIPAVLGLLYQQTQSNEGEPAKKR